MPEVISYGEDALTYWAVTKRLPEILRQLADSSPEDEVLVIYRPSFGRGGATKAAKSTTGTRSEFGEFDAILSSQQATYLVESKWSRSSESRSIGVSLRPQQVLRHRILRWHIDQWRTHRPSGWIEFVSIRGLAFEETFAGFALAPAGSILATNLEFLLKRLCTGPARIRDVLLHIGLPGSHPPSSVSPPEFELVLLDAEVINTGGYFRVQ